MTKALFFDLGGVLFADGYREGIYKFAERYKINPKDLFSACHNHDYWKKFSIGLISEKKYLDEVQLLLGMNINTKELISTIRGEMKFNKKLYDFILTIKNDFLIGVISNHPKEWYARSKKEFKLDRIFEVEAVSGFIHSRKPELKIFKHAIASAGVDPKDSVYIDDSDKHFSVPKELGMQVHLYKNIKEIKKFIKSIK